MDPDRLDALPRWGFASPGSLRDELTALALDGTKTTTAGLLAEYEVDGEAVAQPGERSLLIDSRHEPVALIETISTRVARLADVDDEHARDEGEGYADAAAFRVAHERFWNGYIDDLRSRLGDPGFVLDDDTLIVLERFRVVRRLAPEETADLVVRATANRCWSVYGRHGMILYRTPTFTGWAGQRAFALLTGEPILDLNICNLQPGATAADARELLAVIDTVGAPTVIPVSTRAVPDATTVLREAGFRPLGPEVAMWRPPGPVPPRPGPFQVRRATTLADIAAVSRVIEDAHGTGQNPVERAFNLDAWRAGEVSCYVAWDGGDAASAGWFTSGEGFLGVWEMMTSPRHRRRGAARAVLETALGELASRGPDGTILWASPLGRPLYQSIGFVVFDDVVPWVRGGTDEELALIGAAIEPAPAD